MLELTFRLVALMVDPTIVEKVNSEVVWMVEPTKAELEMNPAVIELPRRVENWRLPVYTEVLLMVLPVSVEKVISLVKRDDVVRLVKLVRVLVEIVEQVRVEI